MDIEPTTEHHSTILAEKACTSFKWTMKDWSLLYNYYSNNVESPEFDLTEVEDCKCQLKFKMSDSFDGNKYAVIEIIFIGEIICQTMQMTLSFVDETMTKLMTVKTLLQNSTNSYEFNFEKSLTERALIEYVKNDTLILFFELVIVKSVKNCALRTNISKKILTIANYEARQKFQALRNVQEFCDVIFNVRDKKIYAHKVVLAASSEVFKNLFTSDIKESMDIEEYDAEIFEALLNYLYTGRVEDIERIANQLIFLANEYQVNDLKEICGNYMSMSIDRTNAVMYLITGHNLCCTGLQKKAIDFLKNNIDVLANSADFKMLSNYPFLIKQVFSRQGDKMEATIKCDTEF